MRSDFVQRGTILFCCRAHNTISDINGTALLVLQRLQSLDISGNKIGAIRNGSFLAPNCLTHLYEIICALQNFVAYYILYLSYFSLFFFTEIWIWIRSEQSKTGVWIIWLSWKNYVWIKITWRSWRIFLPIWKNYASCEKSFRQIISFVVGCTRNIKCFMLLLSFLQRNKQKRITDNPRA